MPWLAVVLKICWPRYIMPSVDSASAGDYYCLQWREISESETEGKEDRRLKVIQYGKRQTPEELGTETLESRRQGWRKQ